MKEASFKFTNGNYGYPDNKEPSGLLNYFKKSSEVNSVASSVSTTESKMPVV